jgi:hypothetical protein
MYETAKKKIENRKKTSTQNLLLSSEVSKDHHYSFSVSVAVADGSIFWEPLP